MRFTIPSAAIACSLVPALIYPAIPPYPLPPDSLVSSQLQTHLAHRHPEEIVGSVSRDKDRTLSIRTMFAVDSRAEDIFAVLKNFPLYQNWALHKINQRLDGGEFLVLLDTLEMIPPTLNTMKVDFAFNIPFFHKRLSQSIRLKILPATSGFRLEARSITTEPDPLARIHVYVRGLEHEQSTRIYMDSTIQLNSTLIFEAFPERVLKTETSQRIQRIVDAYYLEHSRLRGASKSRSSPNPK